MSANTLTLLQAWTETIQCGNDTAPPAQNNSDATVFSSRGDYPDYSDSSITNDEFIAGIFGALTGVERPIVTGFPGDPKQGKVKLSPDHNNYLCFATFTPDDDGKYRRQKKYFAALYAVMLDDVGSKASLDRITLAPSWKLETSPGNFQYGFILTEPLRDADLADRLVNACIDAGLTDPGATGPCARLGRLPVGVNGKRLLTDEDGEELGYWPCRLVEWAPDRRYTVEQFVEGLQIELKESAEERRAKHKSQTAAVKPVTHHDYDVLVARADENPVITALRHRGLYKQPLGDGKHDVSCPWIHEHTDGVDHGTAYFEPSGSYPIGGFKCQHGHCANKRVGALNTFLGITRDVAKHTPTILVQQGELTRIVDAAELELSKTGRHYQRGGIIVTIGTDPGTSETTVKPLPLPSLLRAMAGIAVWQKFDLRTLEWVVVDPPTKYASILDGAVQYPHLPVLNGIARQPYLRPDGTLMSSAGYDAATGMFGVFNARHFKVADTPTREQAKAALSALNDLLSEFAFQTDSDRAAARGYPDCDNKGVVAVCANVPCPSA